MATTKQITLDEVNCMDYPEFMSTFGSVIEHGRLAAASVWTSKPFASTAELHQAFKAYLESLSPELRVAQVRCYPELAGTVAKEGGLSEESLNEHKGAGLLDLSEDKRKELGSLNRRYKEKFAFPFVVCARENKEVAIVQGIQTRLGNDPEVEVETALAEISKIAYYRLMSMLKENEHAEGKL